MAKKHRDRHRKRRGTRRKAPPAPDDYFQFGPLEMARHGRVIEFKNNSSAEEHQEQLEHQASLLPQIEAEIDGLVDEIVNAVTRLRPASLMQAAYMNFVNASREVVAEVDVGEEQALAQRMIDYVQSIIASAPPATSDLADVDEPAWRHLSERVERLFQTVNVPYQVCRTAAAKMADPALDMGFEEHRFIAQLHWCNVRSRRYAVHEGPELRSMLSPHDDVFRELFSISVDEFVDGLLRLQTSLAQGLGEALAVVAEFHRDFVEQMPEPRPDESGDEYDDRVRAQVGAHPDSDSLRVALGRAFGLDLFDVELVAGLPPELLDVLAWEPGGDPEFLAPGPMRGWPLRRWPTFKRPFVKLDGRTLCFDLVGLFDRIYRVVQQAISHLRPGYRETWNQRQKAISEQLPIDFFERLLPGAEIYDSVYYPWKASPSSRAQWCELDGLVAYGDHLFVVEVKAGSFTPTSPADDFEAHVRSLRSLVEKPAQQGARFIQYLEAADEAVLYDREHNEVARLRRSDFAHVTRCAVTVDPFGEVAARAGQLEPLGLDVGAAPIWALSIDDLRVYADLFTHPLVFLHYVEHRMRAAITDGLMLVDELDHLGLYHAHADYVALTEQDARISFTGFRAELDHYFALQQQELPRTRPAQPTEGLVREVLRVVGLDGTAGYRRLASHLLDLAFDYREELSDQVMAALARTRELGRPQPLSTFGGWRATIVGWASEEVPRDPELARQHASTVMVAHQEGDRLVLELTFDRGTQLSEVHHAFLGNDDIDDSARRALAAEATELKDRWVRRALRNGKVGRNDPCPCGSGRKYKRCHLRR